MATDTASGPAPPAGRDVSYSHRVRKSERLERRTRAGIAGQLTPITVFLGVFFIAPLAIFFVYSLWKTAGFHLAQDWNIANYTSAFTNSVDRDLLARTVGIAFEASVASTIIAYAFAHIIRFHLRRWQEPLLFLVLMAMFSGYLVRIYAWSTILGNHGIVNTVLQDLGVTSHPLTFLLYSRTAAVLVLTNFLVPLAILPAYAALQGVSDAEIEAARDLGCRPGQALRKVTLPLAWHGVFASWALTFIIAAGDYITPQLVGGVSGTMIGAIVAADFNESFQWAQGAALAFVCLGVVLVIVTLVRRLGEWVLG
jgi:spermidine/putrescine transport system permease protein